MPILDWFYNLSGKGQSNDLSQRRAIHLSEKSWITVLAWKSKDCTGQVAPSVKTSIKEGGNVGHVAARIRDKDRAAYYASFWPQNGVTNPKEKVNSTTERTFAKDVYAEKGLPQVSETFYTLDNSAAIEEYERIKHRRYQLKTKVNPLFHDQKKENCSSFIYAILRAAGINKLSPTCAALEKDIFAITPNKMAKCVRAAKARELEEYPETSAFEPQQLHL